MKAIRNEYHQILLSGDQEKLNAFLMSLNSSEVENLATDLRFTRELLDEENGFVADMAIVYHDAKTLPMVA